MGLIQIMYFYYPSYAMGLMIGICVVHSFVEFGEKNEKAIHDHIASAMAEDYEVIYYINLSSGEFLEFSKSVTLPLSFKLLIMNGIICLGYRSFLL